MPRAPDLAAARSTDDGAPLPRPRQKVLVVDDWPQVAYAIQRELKGAFEARVMTPHQAQALADVSDLDAAVLGVLMPGLSGLDLAAQLRTRGFRGPMLFVTSSEDPELPARVAAVGPALRLEKPWPANAVRRALRTLLGG